MNTIDRMELQTAEFRALDDLIRYYKDLPAIVDDDYPRMRHRYEIGVKEFLDACVANGRLTVKEKL